MLDIIKIVSHLRDNTTSFKSVSAASSFEHIEMLKYPKLPSLVVWRGGREWQRNSGGGNTLFQTGMEFLNVTVIMNTDQQAAEGNAVVLPNYIDEIDHALLNWPANMKESSKNLESVKDELSMYSEDRFWWTFTYALEVQQSRTKGWRPIGVPLTTIEGALLDATGSLTGTQIFATDNLNP